MACREQANFEEGRSLFPGRMNFYTRFSYYCFCVELDARFFFFFFASYLGCLLTASSLGVLFLCVCVGVCVCDMRQMRGEDSTITLSFERITADICSWQRFNLGDSLQ